MIQLTQFALDVLQESRYLRDCGAQHLTCWRCCSDLHSGMLVHIGPQGAAHTRCLLPRIAVHQLHELLHQVEA